MSTTTTYPTFREWWRCLLSGRPHQVIGGEQGDPYMLRWYVFPKVPWFRVYVHKFLRSDEDRALHDHPWAFVSLILRGRYVEHTADGATLRLPFTVAYRAARTRHRVQLYRNEVTGREDPCWTLIVTGPKVREWGFWCQQTLLTIGGRHVESDRFVPWREWGDGGCGETS